MIIITDIRSMKRYPADEQWAIVRSLKNPGNLKQVPDLSPSWDLFKKYMALKNAGSWNETTFRSEYLPVFAYQMRLQPAKAALEQLLALHKAGKTIALGCFCTDETLCHRSIIAGILQEMGIEVKGIKHDYSEYGRLYRSL